MTDETKTPAAAAAGPTAMHLFEARHIREGDASVFPGIASFRHSFHCWCTAETPNTHDTIWNDPTACYRWLSVAPSSQDGQPAKRVE